MRYLREETPDVIINVVVASNLERNLYLTTELIDMNRSMVIDLNMFDELKRSGVSLDYSKPRQNARRTGCAHNRGNRLWR